MKKLAIAGLGLLILLAVVAPIVTGTVTASSWEDLNREFNQSGGGLAVLETVEYDRGYLGADVLSRLTLTMPKAEAPVEVYLRSEIAHGLTSARTETRLAPDYHQAWLERFQEELPVLVSHAGISGDVDGALKIPEMTGELTGGGRFQAQPVNMEFAFSDNASTVHVTLAWDGLVIEEGESRLRVGTVSLAEDMSRLTDELWVGDVSLSIAEVSTELTDGSSFVLDGITLVSDTHTTDDDRLKNQMDFAIETIDVDGERYGDMRMAFVADNFAIEATNATVEAVNRLNNVDTSGGSESERAVKQLKLFGDFMTALRGLMSQGLSLGIPSMIVNTPDGAVELEFSFVHPQLEEDRRKTMMSLFQYSEGRLTLTLPSALVIKAPPGLQQQVNQLYQQGLILEKNGRLLLDIKLDRMTLNVNGHPIQIPPLI